VGGSSWGGGVALEARKYGDRLSSLQNTGRVFFPVGSFGLSRSRAINLLLSNSLGNINKEICYKTSNTVTDKQDDQYL
jgi:hypothetical protein